MIFVSFSYDYGLPPGPQDAIVKQMKVWVGMFSIPFKWWLESLGWEAPELNASMPGFFGQKTYDFVYTRKEDKHGFHIIMEVWFRSFSFLSA